MHSLRSDGLAAIEFIEADVWVQRVEALSPSIKQRLGVRARRWGRAVALATPGADAAAVNRTFALGIDRPLDAELLAEVLHFFREAGAPRWLVDCSPDATIVGGREALTSQGGVLKTPTVKLVGDLRDVTLASPTSDVTVSEVGVDAAETFKSVVGAAFGRPEVVDPDIVSVLGKPGWHYYMAFDHGKPIAGAAMFTQGHGAWFGVAGTSAAARNRGAQTALLARRLRDARQLGCSWVTAETSPDTPDHPNSSYRNMLRAGLRVAYLRDKYLFENRPAT